MTPDTAAANFAKAAYFVRSRQFEEARSVELLPSDRAVIERRITKARDAEATIANGCSSHDSSHR